MKRILELSIFVALLSALVGSIVTAPRAGVAAATVPPFGERVMAGSDAQYLAAASAAFAVIDVRVQLWDASVTDGRLPAVDQRQGAIVQVNAWAVFPVLFLAPPTSMTTVVNLESEVKTAMSTLTELVIPKMSDALTSGQDGEFTSGLQVWSSFKAQLAQAESRLAQTQETPSASSSNQPTRTATVTPRPGPAMATPTPRPATATPYPTQVPIDSGAHTLTGSIALYDANNPFFPGPNCGGTDGYSDLAPGGQVTVRDQNATIIAVGVITDSVTTTMYSCSLNFVVKDVPEAKFYTIEVTHRGPLSYTYAELVASDWTLSLSIGS